MAPCSGKMALGGRERKKETACMKGGSYTGGVELKPASVDGSMWSCPYSVESDTLWGSSTG
jgi:hypothetical protein